MTQRSGVTDHHPNQLMDSTNTRHTMNFDDYFDNISDDNSKNNFVNKPADNKLLTSIRPMTVIVAIVLMAIKMAGMAKILKIAKMGTKSKMEIKMAIKTAMVLTTLLRHLR